jgi:hypothetical protein
MRTHRGGDSMVFIRISTVQGDPQEVERSVVGKLDMLVAT